MTSANFAPCLEFVLKKEGGFTQDPRDPGGATNLGITIHTLTLWRKHPVTVDDVRNLTRAEATEIYHAVYWHPGDDLHAGVDLIAFNASVNCGQSRAAHWLQGGCGAVEDGVLGPVSMAKIAAMNPCFLIDNFVTAQAAYYRSRPGWATYGKGWMVRLNDAHTLAISMSKSST